MLSNNPEAIINKTKIFIYLFVALTFALANLNAQSWKLVWSDEFDDSALDESKWEYMIGDGTSFGLPSGWGNNELQWYTNDNIRLEDGILVITAEEKSMSGKDYTSSRIRTMDMGDWKYGRFEIRAKMPIGQGIWPALWMLPTDFIYGGWAASGEIDIIEYLGHEPHTVLSTLHYGGEWPANTYRQRKKVLSKGTFHENFHIFALEWEEGKMRCYVDGKQFGSWSSWYTSADADFPAPFDQKFHLLLNLAVGGNLPGSPDATTEFPQLLEIDYVRVYQIDSTTAVEDGIGL